jgi:hypothetical protein
VPEGERAQIKMPGLGQTMLARAARFLAQTGYFYSAWFSLGDGSSLVRERARSGRYKAKHRCFTSFC